MSTEPIQYWSNCPFVVGKTYRVRKTFQAMRDSFVEGEIIVFDREAYSRYDSITGYFFTQEGRQCLRLWDIGDDVDVKVWKEFFELVD